MKLPGDTQIAGIKTIDDWDAIRPGLNDLTDTALWSIAYEEYFKARLTTRYIKPIEDIQSFEDSAGEGFGMMTIMCTLIEFLQATYQGKNYKNTPPLSPYEYSRSGQEFIDFLSTRSPFNTFFNTAQADAFYRNVRCGLLHEARTYGTWVIKKSDPKTVEYTAIKQIIYRDNFFNLIKEYINVQYKDDLESSDDRKRAFLRKFDRLCEE